MSEQGHTPGPWKVDGDDIWHIGKSYEDENDPHIFLATMACGCETCHANANLIAQAPTLLRQQAELVKVAENLVSNFADIMDEDAHLLSREQLVFKLETGTKILKAVLAKCKDT